MTHHTIAVGHISQILQGARSRGVDVDQVLTRADVPPALLQAPMARVTQAQFAQILRMLRRVTRDDFLGMGQHPVPLGAFDQACRLALQESTVGQALRAAFRHYHGVLRDFTARLCVDGEHARIVLDSRSPSSCARWYGERSFLFFTLGVANWLAARRIPILGVDYRSGTRSADAHKLFHAPVRYGQPAAGLRLESRWLMLPVVQNTQTLKPFLAAAPFDLLVKYQARTSLTDRIRRQLRNDLARELPSLAQVSAQLAMTPQTLRRHLREEGQGFQALKDDLRRDVALEYLDRHDLSLMNIAERLGFSEPSTFHRAFKKWTGVSPGEYRRNRLSCGPAAQPRAADTFRQSV
ncbi:AraC family transcriptional regulator [Achromobacter sp. Marseille-Q0513]|uniref:AraC family transcriptional regulator n=1 Tax=Achromobacter sp. Marseille-Q0513 TaxID=2829161 RepID=UPI001B8DD08C|nr:AraC family transcriptional regulator [Achromobacter sp. Marseille-Q0513]MBR8654036.1 AraC family transcriptional regulator [Achromobacter sp. Marseille-Q0513]